MRAPRLVLLTSLLAALLASAPVVARGRYTPRGRAGIRCHRSALQGGAQCHNPTRAVIEVSGGLLRRCGRPVAGVAAKAVFPSRIAAI
jgi:hypothetical protein